MKTVYIIMAITIAVAIALLLVWKTEHYNAVPSIWSWEEQNTDKNERKCMARPGKYFY
jgi:hypothetical protein